MTGRNLLALSFRIIGLVFAAFAAVAAANTTLFVIRAYSAVGTVEGHTTIQNSISVMPESEQTGVLYYPVISFADADGVLREFTGPRGQSTPRFQAGQTVDIRVSQTNPDDARLTTPMGTWGSSIVLAAIAAVFLLLGFVAPFGFGGLRRPY